MSLRKISVNLKQETFPPLRSFDIYLMTGSYVRINLFYRLQEYTRLATSRSLFYAAKNDVVENSGSERLVLLAGAPNSPEQKYCADFF